MSASFAEEVTDLLQRLIRQACVNRGTPDSGQEMRSVAVLEEFFAGSGVEYEIIEPAPGRGNLVARVRGMDPDAPSVALVGHLDVVPADDADLWQHDPFGGDLIDGVVWGRGAIDMLGLTAVFAVVTRALAQGEPLAGDVVFAAVADEEAGGVFGAGWLAAHRPDLLRTDYALTENGGILLGPLDSPGVTLTVGEKGGAPRILTVHGRPGHGSVPWGSRNAAAIAGEIVSRIARSPGRPLLLDHWRAFVLASRFDADLTERLLDPERLHDALDELGPLAGYAHAVTHMTVSPNILQAGDRANVIPGTASVTLDIRLLPGQDGTDVDRYLDETLAELRSAVGVAAPYTAGASSSDPHTPFSAAIAEAVAEQYPGSTLVPVVMPGGTDGRHLRALGATTYGFGLFSPAWEMAGFRAVFHGRDERIDVESLHLAATALDRALRLLGRPDLTPTETEVTP